MGFRWHEGGVEHAKIIGCEHSSPARGAKEIVGSVFYRSGTADQRDQVNSRTRIRSSPRGGGGLPEGIGALIPDLRVVRSLLLGWSYEGTRWRRMIPPVFRRRAGDSRHGSIRPTCPPGQPFHPDPCQAANRLSGRGNPLNTVPAPMLDPECTHSVQARSSAVLRIDAHHHFPLAKCK